MAFTRFRKTSAVFLVAFLIYIPPTSGCPGNCNDFYRKPGARRNLPVDCCGDCLDGYEKVTIHYPDPTQYRCRKAPQESTSPKSSTRRSHDYSTSHTSTPTPPTPTILEVTTGQPTTTTMPMNSTSKVDVGLKTSEIAGAIVCVLVLVLMVVGCLMFFFMRRKRQPPSSPNVVHYTTSRKAKHQSKPGSTKYCHLLRSGQPSDEDVEWSSTQTKPRCNSGHGPLLGEGLKEDGNNNYRETQDIGVHTGKVHQDGDNEDTAIPIPPSIVIQDNEFLPFRVQSPIRHNPFDRERVSFSDTIAPDECNLSLLNDKTNARPTLFIDTDSKRGKDGASSGGSSKGSTPDCTPDCTPGSGNTVNIFQVHQNFNISGVTRTSGYK